MSERAAEPAGDLREGNARSEAPYRSSKARLFVDGELAQVTLEVGPQQLDLPGRGRQRQRRGRAARARAAFREAPAEGAGGAGGLSERRAAALHHRRYGQRAARARTEAARRPGRRGDQPGDAGHFSDEPDSQQFPLPALKLAYPSTGNFIAVVGQLGHGAIVRKVKRAMGGASDLPVESINAPRFVPGVDFSDHASYWNEGFEAVMITDTAFYRNPRYHTEQDTWDTLDYPRMAKVVQGVYCAVTALAAE